MECKITTTSTSTAPVYKVIASITLDNGEQAQTEIATCTNLRDAKQVYSFNLEYGGWSQETTFSIVEETVITITESKEVWHNRPETSDFAKLANALK